MTERELSKGIGEGQIENQVHLFWTKETIKEAGRQKLCPKVTKLAWRKYVSAVEAIPFPATGHGVKLLQGSPNAL